MAAKLLLCVSNDQATVAVWRRRRLLSCTHFDNNEEGWTAFGSFLRSVHGLPVHIIVDTVEEDFRFETLPHIRGRDRTEMVGRKLKQLYRATPYCSFALQERESGKRRDDRYLFAALTNPDLLLPWLRAIEAAEQQGQCRFEQLQSLINRILYVAIIKIGNVHQRGIQGAGGFAHS